MSISTDAEQIQQECRRRSPDSPLFFIRGLTIPSATGPQLFASCIAPFQRKCLEEISPTLLALRDKKKPGRRRFWWERTKKASKDSDIAACLLWLVAFAKRPVFVQVGAADKDQAGIVKRRMDDLLHYNPWVNDLLRIHNYKVISENGLGLVDIVAADVAGSHGETPDLLVINELSHVTKWEFVENLLDNARGVPHGAIVIATNAGFKGTKAEVLRKHSEQSKHWVFHVLDKPAPWITKEDLEEAKRTSKSRSRYQRLWWGKWASGKGDAIGEEDLDSLFREDLHEETKPRRGWQYLAGIDLGVKHDHAGIALVGVNANHRKIRACVLRAFEPKRKTGEVDLQEVEDTVLRLAKVFRATWVGYDPHQAVLMAQRLKNRGLPMQEVPFSTRNITAMAESLLQVIENRTLESYESDELRRDFGKFDIVEKPYGHRLEAVSDEYGHADVGTALVITLPKAVSLLDVPLFSEEDELATEEGLEDEDIDEMPGELREIYDLLGDQDTRGEGDDLSRYI